MSNSLMVDVGAMGHVKSLIIVENEAYTICPRCQIVELYHINDVILNTKFCDFASL